MVTEEETKALQSTSHEQYGMFENKANNINNGEDQATMLYRQHVSPVLERIENMMDENVWSGLIFVAGYMFAGVVAYSFLFEDWDVVDALYFSMVTFTTVGYGDISPGSQIGRLFTCIYAVAGVVIIGAIIGKIGEHVAENQIRITKKKDLKLQETAVSLMQGGNDSGSSSEDDKQTTTLISYDWAEFLSTTLKPYAYLLVPFLLSAWLEGRNQDWTIIDTLYFAVCTITTIGYGDLSPNTKLSRIVAIFFIPFSVFALASIFGSVVAFAAERKTMKEQESILHRGFRLSDLDLMDKDKSGQISELEYVEFMLLSTDKVEKEFLDRLHVQFRSLDKDGSGVLDRSDIIVKIQASTRQLQQQKNGRMTTGAETFYDCETGAN
mmetsp:Transcript_3156/g.4958  ORF Transcript_3156/g.4958 Transcript_3156/m.4958 type:complete len:381 (+) Transcript_3156:58-1200(+)|eukprot:CAMPEP_0196823042 /NCGR_PEP_ID=MMETSP1362-20130617/85875_1 /TAXON_ID=163516 /ORGANISM="Leptocylindrus danicus, Strain CCMP1856" /LENGTH=380 /DNA_ID=CAMNT_0042202777 /DNA_START=23 /DNA_END=1165 /DNA_ORIENTATION=+